MSEYIDKEKLRQAMFQEAFAKDSDLQRWDSGCWIRYKLFENVLERTEVADVITRDEGIRLGAELAAMHGSDATSQDLEKAYWRGFEDAMQKRDVQPVKWIPVTERLPEERINPNTRDFEYVLCTTIFGDVRPFKFGTQIGQRVAHFWNGAGYVDAYVTHWKPLPKPPKDGET